MGVIHGNFKRIAVGSGIYHEIGGNVTILACLPCMAMLRSREARNLYVNC